MAMNQPNFELSNSYNFLFRIIQVLIKVPSDNMNIPRQSLEVVVSVLGAEVSCAEDVLDLPWNQQFFEFGWEAVASMWNVKIS